MSLALSEGKFASQKSVEG